jgi:hypothetical protein
MRWYDLKYRREMLKVAAVASILSAIVALLLVWAVSALGQPVSHDELRQKQRWQQMGPR